MVLAQRKRIYDQPSDGLPTHEAEVGGIISAIVRYVDNARAYEALLIG
ncbi:hypothetical protein [Lentibacillus salinarum]|uniref:Uncharacterized protein n=1 Tax=Lentibacillus salinarum TaxID=446820 RepID=A0ABW3ZUL1_9BACI